MLFLVKLLNTPFKIAINFFESTHEYDLSNLKTFKSFNSISVSATNIKFSTNFFNQKLIQVVVLKKILFASNISFNLTRGIIT